MKSILFTILILTIILMASSIAFAQLPGLPIDDPPQTPIDGGLSLLAAGGGIYAWKKLRNKKD